MLRHPGIFSFKKPRSSGRTRQASRIHFDGRSSPCLHAHGNEQRHNGFGYRVSPASASQGRRLAILPRILLIRGHGIRAGCHHVPALPFSARRAPKTKKPAQGRLPKYGLRRQPAPHNDGDRHADLRKVFSGLDGGLGEGRGSFTKNAPSFPQPRPR